MPDNIVIQTNPKVITVTQQSNNIVVSAPGPQGPTGQMIITDIPTVSPIINTGSGIAFDQIAQYITLDTRYAKITGSVQYSASSGSALYSTNAGSATYATNSGSSLYSNLSASTSQTNFATLFVAGSAVATQSYVNNASVLFATLSSSAQYSSSAGYANLAGTSASLNGSPASSYALKTYVDSASLNAYNAASAFTLAQGYQTSTGSVSYAASAGTAVNSNTTSQTNFNPLTISGSAVATQNYVNSQDFQKSTGSVAFAINSGSSVYANNAGNSSTTDQTSFDHINVTASTQSTNTTNGALVVAGGIGTGDSVNIGGNLNVTGNIFMSGSSFTIGASNLAVADSIIYLSASNYYSDLLDIGYYGAYGVESHNSASNHYHTGLVRDHLDGKWKLFSAGIEPAEGTINFASATYDTLKLGTIEVSSSALISSLNAQYLNSIPSSSLALNTYVNAQDSNYYASAQAYANSASLNSYNTSSAYTATGTYNNTNASVGYAINSSSLAGIGSASYARLDQAQTFIGTQTFNNFIQAYGNQLQSGKMTLGQNTFNNSNMLTVTSNASTNIGIAVKAFASQTADLQQWQNSSASILAGVTASGQIYTGSAGIVNTGTFNQVPQVYIATPSSSMIGLYLKAASTTQQMFSIQDSAGARRFDVDANGSMFISGTIFVGGGLAAALSSTGTGGGFLVNAPLTSQTVALTTRSTSSANVADIQQWQSNGAINVAGISKTGQFYTGSAGPLANTSSVTAQISVYQSASNIPGIIVRSNQTASVAANLQEWQRPDGGILWAIPNTTLTPMVSSFALNQQNTLSISTNYDAQVVTIRGNTAGSQTLDLLRFRDTSSNYIAGVTASGQIYTGSSTPLYISSIPAQMSVVTASANTPGIIVRGSASQTAILVDWQNSVGTSIASIGSDGSVRTSYIANTSGAGAIQIAANRNVAFGNTGDFGGGSLVVAINNTTASPTSNPTAGGIIYVEGGALKYRGSGGGINTIAPAVSDGTILGDATIDGGSA